MAVNRQNYHDQATTASDTYLAKQLREWRQFRMPLTELSPEWRAYVGIVRREAHRRGIWSPE